MGEMRDKAIDETGSGQETDMPIWFLYSGTGSDGGFGDYAEPVWDEEPVRTRDGRLLWFLDKAAAERAADALSARESKAFYADGCHDAYDGDFPTEFMAVKSYVPANVADGACTMGDAALLDAVPLVGRSSWGSYDENGRIEEDGWDADEG